MNKYRALEFTAEIMRPYQYLPMPMPAEYDPAEKDPLFFYNNFVKSFIPDMIQMMNTGITIDDQAVEELRVTIDNVLIDVTKRLNASPLIKQFQEHQKPAAQKAWEKEATKSIRTIDYYVKSYNPKDIVHRTWVVNSYLINSGKTADVKDSWTIKSLKQYNIFANDAFIKAIIEKRILPSNPEVKKGMLDLAEYKLELWNRPRYDKAAKPVPVIKFNPNSAKQKQAFFEMLNIEPFEKSSKTGDGSWGRDQIEELQKASTDKELLNVLSIFIDFSYSAIIKNNFLKAFDSYTIDGVLHGNIKLFGAKSFRNTSNNPNLLNAPSTKSIYAKPLKRCFKAPSGYVIYTVDLNGLEDRGIANLSGDKNKIALFQKGLDGHSLAATYYFKDRVSKLIGDYTDHQKASVLLNDLVNLKNTIAKTIRQDGKPVSFGLSYGAYPKKVATSIKCTIEEATRIFDAYHHELYPGITDYRENYVLPTARNQGYLHLGLGCRIYTDDADQDIRTLNNATVQFWSILTLIAINELNYRIREERLTKEIQVTSTIYDSIYNQVIADAEIVKWLNDNIVEILCRDYLEDQVIPNEAEGEIGLNWADLHSIKNNASVEEIQAVMNILGKK